MSWNMVKLSSVLTLEYGKALPDSDRHVDGDYSAYGANGQKSRTNKFLYEKPSIIVGRKGSAGELTLVMERFWALDVAYYVTHDEKVTDLRYLYYALQTKNLSSYARGIKPGINRNDIYELQIPLPSLATQQKIVAKLDAIFTEIDKAVLATEANVKNAEALLQSYLQLIFNCNDSDWSEKKIDELFKVASSKRVLKSDWKFNGVPFYRGREISTLSKYGAVKNELYISDEMYEEYSKKYGVPSHGDIMLTAIGTIGNSYVVKDGDKFYFKDASVLWLKKEAQIESDFVNYWFKSASFKNQLDVGLGATVDTLTIGKVQSLKINIPSLSTQKEILDKINLISNLIAKSKILFQEKYNELHVLKKSVLNQAFNGNLVKD